VVRRSRPTRPGPRPAAAIRSWWPSPASPATASTTRTWCAASTNPNVEFVIYPDAHHAFFSDDRPQVYQKAAAEDAWKRCVAFFSKHLKA